MRIDPLTLPLDQGPDPDPEPEPAIYRISDLCAELEGYLPLPQVQQVYEAFLFGAEAHEGQTRKSGEPYIHHPLAVARILAGLHLDHHCLVAAILHDTIEDTPTAEEQLTQHFGSEVAELVEGVSKFSKVEFKSRAEAQAENFRKMVMAMTRDIRVVFIKLADRLHNMSTIAAMPPQRIREIARETLELYVPLASRLGMDCLRRDLEDLAFAACWPWRYRVLLTRRTTIRGHHALVVENAEKAIRRRLQQEGIAAEVSGHPKDLYGIYQKLKRQHHPPADITDVYILRILVAEADDCYRTLGAVHNLFKPVLGRFRDYIAIPKSNAYQSLHTVLVAPQGIRLNVHIRTREMHRIAETGVTAHWMRKSQGDGHPGGPQTGEWLKNLIELLQNSRDSAQFIKDLKDDLFPDEVYVFTPRGDIRALPRGATPVDFAYAVHTSLGNRCHGVLIDQRAAALNSPLGNGQTVQIVTAPNAQPSPAWLRFVITAKARSCIRNYLKHQKGQQALAMGREMLKEELAHLGLGLDQVNPSHVAEFLRTNRLASLEELLAEIGLGNQLPLLVARCLSGLEGQVARELRAAHQPAGRLVIKGTEGVVLTFAKCCRPIHGDSIAGLFSPGKGIVVHRQGCHNLLKDPRREQHWLGVDWNGAVEAFFSSELRIEVHNQLGVLGHLAKTFSDMGSNIEKVVSEERDGLTLGLFFMISVKNRQHLAQILRRLRTLPEVMRVARLSH
ncbi:MAG: bifunctional (p)ppGpp synthetase/guanosine-3',5'-bis(diphosphate) 3'-pyrophosphohydrolase [Pseudomonadota bacterium]